MPTVKRPGKSWNGVSRRIMACPQKDAVMAALRHFPTPSPKGNRCETNEMHLIKTSYMGVDPARKHSGSAARLDLHPSQCVRLSFTGLEMRYR